jgi:hypothetical protein
MSELASNSFHAISAGKISSKLAYPDLQTVLFRMGLFGVLLFLPAYLLLAKGVIDYKSLLLFESMFFATPHLMSTYLKAFTDKAELQRHKFACLALPFIMLLFIAAFIKMFGMQLLWSLGSVYFYWQWWHHARQSFGLGRIFQREDLQNLHLTEQTSNKSSALINDCALWAVAILGICLKSNQAGDYYEGVPIRVIHLPLEVIGMVAFCCIACLFVFATKQIELYQAHQKLETRFIVHLTIQSFVFVVFFGLLPTDIGIIAASFWHCTQYITFVKAHQKGKVEHSLIQLDVWKNIFSKQNIFVYFAVLFCLSLLLPLSRYGLTKLQMNTLAFAFGMTLTFHHYILDAIFWTKGEMQWCFGRVKAEAKA